MTDDSNEVREGDVRLVECRVISNEGDFTELRTGIGLAQWSFRLPRRLVAASRLISRAPKPEIGVGDMVEITNSAEDAIGTVKAVCDDEAWVEWLSGAAGIYALSNLTLVEGGENG